MSRRAVINGVVAILILGAVVCLGFAARDFGRMKRVDGSPAFRMPVEFAAEGVYRATVREEFTGGCRRVFRVREMPAVDAGAELDAAMKGLEGDIVVADRDGKEFYREGLGWSAGAGWGGRGILAEPMYPRGAGPYVVTIRVRKPAAGMAGKRSEVVGEYDFCESEMMSVLAKGAVGVGLAVVAGIVRWLSKRAARA